MPRWFAILLAVLLVTFLSAIAWRFSAMLGPVYNGKPVEYWLQSRDSLAANFPNSNAPPVPTRQQAEEAIRHLGAKAIPALLQRIRAHDSALKLRLIDLAQRMHLFKKAPVPVGRINASGFEGFKILGAEGANAVPSLIEIADQKLSLSSQCYAIDCLGCIGPDAKKAVPSLLRWLADSNGPVRWNAAIVLGQIHAEPEVVVPALVKSLHDPDDYVRSDAIKALGAFGLSATSAVPTLIECLKDPRVSFAVPDALRRIVPDAASQVGSK